MSLFVMMLGTELGSLSVSGGQGATRYYSNSSVIAVDQSTGVVTLQQPLDYAVSAWNTSLLARLHIVLGARLVTVAGVCRLSSSSSVKPGLH